MKRVSGGLVSNWLHDNIKVGSELKLSSPMGTFTCCDNPAQKLLLISAGSGITPMMSMARWICDTATEIDVVFFYSARRVSDIIFRQELELMAARYPNFKPVVTITKPEPGFTWLGYSGRLTEAMLHSVAADFRHRTVYVCGPDSFMQEVEGMLERLGFPMQNCLSIAQQIARRYIANRALQKRQPPIVGDNRLQQVAPSSSTCALSVNYICLGAYA